ncbi:MAG TPA: GntP family permease [Saprospiraceae bacterium]|nr:GntP family permease [Saprospiraceae bacterium]
MKLIILLILAIVLIILCTAKWKIHPFLALLGVSLCYGILAGVPMDQLLPAVNAGFGGTLEKIGLVILVGVLLGAFLEHSGGAFSLARKLLSWIGPRRLHAAMASIGYLISIPVFADSGFIIMHSLNKSLTKQAGFSMAGTGTALMLGLMLTHTMVPPTPGPIAAAGIIGADLGLVILWGLIVSFIVLIPAILYSRYWADKTYIAPQIDLEDETEGDKHFPGALHAFLPIIIPILLIIVSSVVHQTYGNQDGLGFQLLRFFGNPLMALLIGLLLAMTLPAKFSMDMLSTTGWTGKALIDAAIIILVTGAGGIFGKVLEVSGIAEVVKEGFSGLQIGIWLPFFIAAALKTAQGSSTVALVTTASMIAPMMSTLGFETDLQKALAVVAIGAGSAVFSHANDSGFWVVTQFTGMDVKTGYKVYSPGTFLLGFGAALIVFIFYNLLT